MREGSLLKTKLGRGENTFYHEKKTHEDRLFQAEEASKRLSQMQI